MKNSKKGQAKIVARARLMQLLGEQLITDEVAAISELVKNAYDADAKEVTVILSNVSNPKIGYIIIKDNGNGMSFKKVISSWLELGTLSKARQSNLKPRYSESGKRISLGEKGLGRLSVHKLGLLTELVTKRKKSNNETKIILNWEKFEKNRGFLDEVPVEWEIIEPPQIFSKTTKGTQITIKKLQRKWNKEIIEKVKRNIMSLKSPFEDLSDFNIKIEIEDKISAEIEIPEMSELINRATYTFTAEIDNNGTIKYDYIFKRPDLSELNRERLNIEKDIRNPADFSGDRRPTCGAFSVRFYSWDPNTPDLKAVFGDTAIYNEIIKPNSGVKVFRDGFRVLPYGNPDNDWLSMDMERVRQFERKLSRNQIIGAILIKSDINSYLLDKTDREGLIDNEAFRDFKSLVKSTLTEFEAERFPDRRNIKIVTGRIREEKTDQTVFTKSLADLSGIIDKQNVLDDSTKNQINNLITETRETLDNLISDKEEPLLVAASIGITYMMPIHEVRRDLHEALNILRTISKSQILSIEQIQSLISLIKQTDLTVGGIGKLMQKKSRDEFFKLEKSANEAIELMHHRLERNNIEYKIDILNSVTVKGSERLITILLLNFLDNSIYWLLRKKPEERKIKIIIGYYENKCILAVSDSGPGFEDNDINLLTLPFFTRKSDGMGLGLYIADRIAQMNGGKLKLLNQNEISGLYSGANIAVILPK